jgi:hypothetical protein
VFGPSHYYNNYPLKIRGIKQTYKRRMVEPENKFIIIHYAISNAVLCENDEKNKKTILYNYLKKEYDFEISLNEDNFVKT